jgi:hypothetical protein
MLKCLHQRVRLDSVVRLAWGVGDLRASSFLGCGLTKRLIPTQSLDQAFSVTCALRSHISIASIPLFVVQFCDVRSHLRCQENLEDSPDYSAFAESGNHFDTIKSLKKTGRMMCDRMHAKRVCLCWRSSSFGRHLEPPPSFSYETPPTLRTSQIIHQHFIKDEGRKDTNNCSSFVIHYSSTEMMEEGE